MNLNQLLLQLHHHLIQAKAKLQRWMMGRGRAALLILLQAKEAINQVYFKVQQVPKNIKQAVVIWVAGEAITYSTLFVKWLPDTFTSGKIDLFLCPWYHNPMHLKWWLYYLTEELAKFSFWLGTAKAIVNYSDVLFLVSVIFLGMRIIDVVMYLWNFKEYDLIYADLFYMLITLLWAVFKGYDTKKIAKVKSLF